MYKHSSHHLVPIPPPTEQSVFTSTDWAKLHFFFFLSVLLKAVTAFFFFFFFVPEKKYKPLLYPGILIVIQQSFIETPIYCLQSRSWRELNV